MPSTNNEKKKEDLQLHPIPFETSHHIVGSGSLEGVTSVMVASSFICADWIEQAEPVVVF